MKLIKNVFGKLPDGSDVYLYTIVNESMEISLTNYGCIITSLKVLDRNDDLGEVVLGFDKLESYLKPHPYFGAIVGPVANRISGAKYVFNNEEISLDANEGKNQLHGGSMGFDKMLWREVSIVEDENFIQVNLAYLRPDGLMGYPGNLDFKFSMTVYKNNRIDLNYFGTTDKSTPVNITHHDYFNLTDGGGTDILDHLVMISAKKYTPTKDDKCVTGEIISVNKSPFDFSSFKKVGTGIKELYGEISAKNGIDHNFVLSGESPIAATVRCDISKRQLEIYTNKRCVQFYASNHLDGSLGRIDQEFKAFHALCLETQSFPDSVNHNNFPSVILNADEEYDYFTSYVFSTF